MSDHDPARDRRDELASRLLDGELPEEEAAAARRDPAVVARMDDLAAARSQVRDVPPLPAAAQAATLAAALDAFDDDAGTATGAQVTAIGAARDRRRRVPRWLGAAAAAVALVAGVAGLAALAGQGSSGDQSTAGGSTAAESSDEGASQGGGGDSGAGGGAASSPPVDLGDVGDVGSVDQLGALVTQQEALVAAAPGAERSLDTESTERAAPSQGDAEFEAYAKCQRSAGAELQGRARLDGRDVAFWVVDGAQGRRLLVLGAGCEVVADQPLP
jgi:hypothetical protein